MKFNKNTVNLVILIILFSLTALVVYVALEEFGLITHEIKNEPFEYPKQQ